MKEVRTYYIQEGNTVRQVAEPLPNRETREREKRQEELREKRLRQRPACGNDAPAPDPCDVPDPGGDSSLRAVCGLCTVAERYYHKNEPCGTAGG